MIYVPRTVTLLPILWTFALLSLLPSLGWDPPAWCCQDLIAYGLCWLPWWC